MILVDTSVWIDHLRKKEDQLTALLEQSQVFMHPMVLGELACGSLKNRKQLVGLWQNLPMITQATDAEALYCLEKRQFMGRGIGYVDLHLLAATLLSSGTLLWTRDRRLRAIATEQECVMHELH